MKTTELDDLYESVEPSTRRRVALGWCTEAVGTLGAIACALLGLAGVLPSVMAGVSTLIIGLTLLVEGGVFASRFRELVSRKREEGRAVEWGGIITAEFLGGTAATILGALALFEIGLPVVLIVAVLVLGATFLFSSMVSLESGGQAIGGVCAFVLGLLAVAGINPVVSTLIALSILGLAGLISGAVTARSILRAA